MGGMDRAFERCGIEAYFVALPLDGLLDIFAMNHGCYVSEITEPDGAILGEFDVF
jgi:hypothetical protein